MISASLKHFNMSAESLSTPSHVTDPDGLYKTLSVKQQTEIGKCKRTLLLSFETLETQREGFVSEKNKTTLTLGMLGEYFEDEKNTTITLVLKRFQGNMDDYIEATHSFLVEANHKDQYHCSCSLHSLRLRGE